MSEKIDTGKEAKTGKPAEGSADAVEKKVSAETKETKGKVDAIVKPEEPPKPGEKTKPAAAEPKPESTSGASNVRHNDSMHDAPPDARNEPFKYARNTIIGGAAAMTALGSYGTTYLSQIPLLGKIPFFPQAGAAMFSGLNSLVTPLGLGTGASATNSALAIAPTWAGPLGAAVLGIPTALWGIGMAKNWIKGDDRKKGYWGNVADATELIASIPFMPYHYAMKARVKTGEIAQSTWNIAKTPFKGAWNLGANIAKGAWNMTTATTSAALTPTKWGIGGALLGVALSGGSAAAIPVTAGLGYGILNYLKNTGAMNGKDGGSSSGHGH